MLKAAYNELELTVLLQGHSPLLVKDGRFTDQVKKDWNLGDSAPHAIFMCRDSMENLRLALQTPRYSTLDYFIPGSSLKGALRAHLERVLRGMTSGSEQERICDPLDEEHSCSRVLAPKGRDHADFPYRGACPVCRLFGYTLQAGRIRFSDAVRLRGSAEVVQNVSISRQTGSVLHPHFSLAIVGAEFRFQIRLRNFERWHLGLLATLFSELAARRVSIGSAKSRGFGEVSASVSEARLTYMGRAALQTDLAGIAELSCTQDETRYGFALRSSPPAIPLAEIVTQQVEALPWRKTYAIDASRLWEKTRSSFWDYWWPDGGGLLKDRMARGFAPEAKIGAGAAGVSPDA